MISRKAWLIMKLLALHSSNMLEILDSLKVFAICSYQERRLQLIYVKYCQNKPKSDFLVSQDQFEQVGLLARNQFDTIDMIWFMKSDFKNIQKYLQNIALHLHRWVVAFLALPRNKGKVGPQNSPQRSTHKACTTNNQISVDVKWHSEVHSQGT